jgi:hypothetical protein
MRIRLLPSLALFGLGFFLSALLGYLYMPYALRGGATRFAPGFSEFRFQMLRPGEPLPSVVAALGEPLAVEPLPAVDAWIYYPPDWAGAPHRTGDPFPAARRVQTEFTQFQFDADGRVDSMFGRYLEPLPPFGTPRDGILARYGIPTFRLARPPLTARDYALPAGTKVWKVRRLLFGADDRLVAPVGYTHFSAVRLLPSIGPFTTVQ